MVVYDVVVVVVVYDVVVVVVVYDVVVVVYDVVVVVAVYVVVVVVVVYDVVVVVVFGSSPPIEQWSAHNGVGYTATWLWQGQNSARQVG